MRRAGRARVRGQLPRANYEHQTAAARTEPTARAPARPRWGSGESYRVRAGLPTEQTPDAQVAELYRAGAERVYVDHGESSRIASCPQWVACLARREDQRNRPAS